MWKTLRSLWKSLIRFFSGNRLYRLAVALVLLIVVGLVAARVYVGRLGSVPETTSAPDEDITALQRKLNLPQSLIGQEITGLTADLHNLFSKALGGEHREIEITLLKWKAKFFVVSVRQKKILDAFEGPFWGEDQGWFIGCQDKPGAVAPRLENTLAFAGWHDNQRKILKAWRVDKATGRFSVRPENEFKQIDCTRIPGWIEDFEDADEGG